MVTVEGMFVLLDRATPKLRDIRNMALEADAAVEKLGLSLDALGSTKRLRNLENTQRTIKTLGRDTEASAVRAERSIRSLDRHASNFGNTLRTLRTGFRDVFQEIWRFARPGGMIVGLGTAIGVAGQAIGALSGGVIALLPRVLDLSGALAPAIAGFAGIGGAVAASTLAFGGLSKAMGGNKQAMRDLTPQARALVRELKQMHPLIQGFRSSAQRGLFPGVTAALGRARVAAPTINRILQSSGRNLGNVIQQGANRVTQRGFLSDIENISGQGNLVVRDMGAGLLNLASALRHVAVAAAPFTRWLSSTILAWTRHADIMARNGRESGRLASFFERTRVSLTQFGHILGNLWVTFRNLGRAARPLGNELWNAAERATAGWARVTGTISGRVGLAQQFNAMGATIKSVFNLVGDLGKALFRLGSGPGAAKTLTTLRQLVPVLENILNNFANTFGPQMAQSLVALGNVVGDLAGATGPFTILLKTLTMTFDMLHGILNIIGPFKSVVTTMFGTALIVRYLGKLGLLEFGWRRVAVAAETAAVAQAAASAAGGSFIPGGRAGRGGFGFRLGSAGLGLRAGLGRLIGRRGAGVATGTMADFATGAAFGAAPRGLLGLGRGAAAGGAALGVARAGLGVAGRFILPLAAIQGALGGFTAARSGGFLNQANQTSFGILNGISGGLLGHFLGARAGVDTPEQRAERAASGIQARVGEGLQDIERTRTGYRKLTDEIQFLGTQSRRIQDRQTQASQALLTQIRAEIQARRQVLTQLQVEARQRGQQSGMAAGASINAALPGLIRKQGAVGGFRTALGLGMQQIGLHPGAGPQDTRFRGTLMNGLLGGLFAAAQKNPALMPVYLQAVQQFGGVLAAHGHGNFQISQGHIFSGSGAERANIRGQLGMPREILAERSAVRLTHWQLAAVASLVAYGLAPGQALAIVKAADASGRLAIPRVGMLTGRTAADGQRPHATGGRIAGRGLGDTVPLGAGGMAAPGELIVNRHTERSIDSLLRPAGVSLGGMVENEGRRHGQTFATGGRYHGHPGNIGAGIRSISDAVLGHFPGLGVGATTDGNHVGGSYHYKGMAVDIGGPYSTLQAAGTWLGQNYGASLIEGIHNNTLSIKNGKNVPSSFWGPSTWAGHAGHIHIAAGAAAAGAAAAGAAAAAQSGAAGVPGQPAGPRHRLVSDILKNRTRGLEGVQGIGGGLLPVAAKGATTAGAAAGQIGASIAAGASVAGGASRTLGHQMMLRHGWGEAEWDALNSLWTGESTWRWNATNPSSGAYGIPQSLPGSKMASAGADWKTNPATQIKWGLDYISGRYGSPSRAYRSWLGRNPHWYGTGGRTPRWGGWHQAGLNSVFSTPTMIGVGEKGAERVTVKPAGRRGGGGSATMHNEFHIYGGEPGAVQREVERALMSVVAHLDSEPIDGDDLG